jgi:hypothetical protein
VQLLNCLARAARLRAPPELLAIAGRARRDAHARADALSVVLVRGVQHGDEAPGDAEPVLAAERRVTGAASAEIAQAPALLIFAGRSEPDRPRGTAQPSTSHIYTRLKMAKSDVSCFPPTYIVEILCSFSFHGDGVELCMTPCDPRRRVSFRAQQGTGFLTY